MEIPPESLPIFARQTLSSFREPSVRLIIVVGAGIAGLAAARRLRSLQYGVIVVEARDRYGGRIFSDRNGIDFSSNYFGDIDRNSALTELCNSIGCDVSRHFVPLESDDPLAYPISGSNLSLYYLRCGYRPILSRLVADLDIKYGETVVEVDAIDQAPFIVVKTESGQSWVADGVICTVPISLLKEGAINFVPVPFGDQLDGFVMETLNNVIMEFPSVFWPFSPDTFTLGSQIVFQSLARANRQPVLIVTTSDPFHEQVTVKELVEIMMEIIRSQFPDAPYPVAAVRTAWNGDRFARGAFPRRSRLPGVEDRAESQVRQNKSGEARDWWRSDVTEASPLAFAGDACTRHRIGNIQVAVKSAWDAAKHLHEFFGKLSPRIPPWSSTISTKTSSISSLVNDAELPAPPIEPGSPSGASMTEKSEPEPVDIQVDGEPLAPSYQQQQDPSPSPSRSHMDVEPILHPGLDPGSARLTVPDEVKQRLESASNAENQMELEVRGDDIDRKREKKERSESSKKERDGTKAIVKYIARLVKEIGPNLKVKHAEYIQNRVTERMIEEWKAKGCIAEFLTSERKQRIRHFVQKYVEARSKPAR